MRRRSRRAAAGGAGPVCYDPRVALRTPPRGTYRYQLRGASLLLRYVPVFIGAILAGAFSLSILHDGGDIARAAWTTGDELLGLFGGFGLVAFPAIFLASAFARRGVPRRILRVRDAGDAVQLDLEGRRRILLDKGRVRSGHVHPVSDRVTRISLELAGGVTDGDRVVLDLDPEAAALVEARFLGARARLDLTSESWALGGTLSAASVLTGIAAGGWLIERLHLAMAAHGLAEDAAASGAGLSAGIMVAAVGLVRAVLALALAAPAVVAGIDGLSIEGAFRRRFVPYRDVASVALARWGISIRLRDGRRVRVGSLGLDAARARALLHFVEAHLSEAAPASPRVPALAPGTAAEWRRAIVEATASGGYRDAALSNEALASALVAPGLDAESRVATAIALLARGEGPSSIRVAATAVAEDTTRDALERLAEGEADDAALEALLLRRRSSA